VSPAEAPIVPAESLSVLSAAPPVLPPDLMSLPPPLRPATVPQREEVLKEAAACLAKGQTVLLAQCPGFGKTTFVLSLIQKGGITFMFVPTCALQAQVLLDLRSLKVPAVSLHDVLNSRLGTVPVVNMYSAVVGIFDHMPQAYPFVRTALERRKAPHIVVDEVHLVQDDSCYRFKFQRAGELGLQLAQTADDFRVPWLLMSGTLRVEDEKKVCDALSIKEIHFNLRGPTRLANVSFKIVHCASFADACAKASGLGFRVC
jgi:hypothetical protein